MAAGALVLPVTASATFTHLGAFGGGSLYAPGAVAITPTPTGAAANVLVAEDTTDNGDDVLEFTPAGSPLGAAVAQTFTCQTTVESLDGPTGLAVDPTTGDLFVTDGGDDRVIEFSPSFNFLAQIGGGEVSKTCGSPHSPDTAGSSPGSFDDPTGLSVGAGQLFVAQPGPDSGSGGNTYVDEVPVPLNESTLRSAELRNGAFGDAVYDPATGDVYAADSALNNIDVYTLGGTLVHQWGPLFDGMQFSEYNPQWDALDPLSGVLYVADSAAGDVYTFDVQTGDFLGELSGLATPEGLAVDPVNHVLYVASDGDDTVERYSYTPAPSCIPQSAGANLATAVPFTLSCTDQAGAAVTYAIAQDPGHGTLSAFNAATGAVTYTPAAGYSGTDTFTYTGASVDGTSQPATVTINVGPPPTCAPEALLTAPSTALPVVLACSGSAATPAAAYRIVTPPAHGTLSAPSSGGALTYTPKAGFSGVDSFTYEGLSTGGTPSSPETVTIHVGKKLPAPVAYVSANVLHARGLVFVTLPGQTQPIPLVTGMQIPLGSIIDATNGRVELIVSTGHGLQHADFFRGEFRLTQSTNTHARRATTAKASSLYAILDLLGKRIPKARCTSNAREISGSFPLRRGARLPAALSAKVHEKGKPVRQLWGSGHGNFTTVGSGSSSSVRGTRWAIFDYPDGTLTRDFTDSVSVYDFHTHRTTIVVAGHVYFAVLGNLKTCR